MAECVLGEGVALLGVNAETLHRCGIVAAFIRPPSKAAGD